MTPLSLLTPVSFETSLSPSIKGEVRNLNLDGIRRLREDTASHDLAVYYGHQVVIVGRNRFACSKYLKLKLSCTSFKLSAQAIQKSDKILPYHNAVAIMDIFVVNVLANIVECPFSNIRVTQQIPDSSGRP